MKLRVAMCVAIAVSLSGAAQAGTRALGPLDPSFGDGGRASVGIGGGPSVMAMARDGSGGFVVTGSANAAADEWAFLRIDRTGRPDHSFGYPQGAALRSPYPPATLAPRPTGGWLVAGAASSSARIGVAAHRPDGLRDLAFDGDGVLEVDLGPGVAEVGALAVLPDGRALVGGALTRETSISLFVVRLTPSGQLDPGWGVGGVTEVAASSSTKTCEVGVRALLPDNEGRVLVAGTQPGADDPPVPVLMRLRADGRVDGTFGSHGTTLLAPAGAGGVVVGATRRGDGAVVGLTLGDVCRRLARKRFGATAVRSDGRLDTGYGSGGRAAIAFPASVTASAVAALPGGRLALAGEFASPISPDGFVIARLTANGSLDRGFGGGRTCTQLHQGQRVQTNAAVGAPGGRLLVGGSSGSDDEALWFALYRRAFTPGGVECFRVETPRADRPLRSVRLRTILGRRARLRLRLLPAPAGGRTRFATACLGTRGPGDVALRWDARVGGRTLRPGYYRVVLEAVDARGDVLGRSYPAYVSLGRRASGPRGPRC